MKASRTQNIKRIALLLLSFCLFNCNYKRDNKEDVITIIKIINKTDNNDPESNFVADKIGPLSLSNGYSEGSIKAMIEAGLEPDFVIEDLEYIDEQLKKISKENAYWSKRDVGIEGQLVDVFKISTENRAYSEKWWNDFETKYSAKAVKMYSYPVFNLNHDMAFMTYRVFTSEIAQNSGYITCLYKKDAEGNWKKPSCESVY